MTSERASGGEWGQGSSRDANATSTVPVDASLPNVRQRAKNIATDGITDAAALAASSPRATLGASPGESNCLDLSRQCVRTQLTFQTSAQTRAAVLVMGQCWGTRGRANLAARSDSLSSFAARGISAPIHDNCDRDASGTSPVL